MYTQYILLLHTFPKRAFFIGKSNSFTMDICAERQKQKLPLHTAGGALVFSDVFYSFPHCLPVKNRSVVVARNTLPACSTVLGKLGKLGEQG